MNAVAVQPLPPVTDVNQLTPVERFRMNLYNVGNEETINRRGDLQEYQKQALVEALNQRTTQAALDRLFYSEPTNIAIRGINLAVTPPETLCQTFIKGGAWSLGAATFIYTPVVTTVAIGSIFCIKKTFDSECFMNRFFSWIGC